MRTHGSTALYSACIDARIKSAKQLQSGGQGSCMRAKAFGVLFTVQYDEHGDVAGQGETSKSHQILKELDVSYACVGKERF